MPDSNANPSQFVALEQSNLVEQVKEKLLAAIVSGELGPGERIVEAELARRMGISRGPVREAARLLQQWGILTAEARRGFFVRKVSLDEIDQLADYRICIEAYASKRAVARATKAQINTLREKYNAVVAAEKKRDQDPLAALESTFDFHMYIFDLSGNPRLTEAFTNLLIQVRQIATLVNIADEASDTFFGKYLLQIVEAFETGDPDRVEKTVTKYLAFSRDQTKKFYIDYYQTH